jgi:HPt (histidine-containing phosphotransfer) domain-containing protein
MVFEPVTNLSEPRDGPQGQPIAPGVLDMEVLKSFEGIKSDDGSDIVIELIDLYLQCTPPRIQQICQAAAEKELVSLKQIAHTLKGSSSTIGLGYVANACHDLEVAITTSTGVLDSLVQSLEMRFLEARTALIAERKRRRVGQSAS